MDLIKNPFDLTGKVAIVMGAGDLGNAIAPAIAYRGADVFCFDINEGEAEKTCELCKEAGVKSYYMKVDVTSEKSIESAYRFVMNQYNKIDILVNACAITFHRPATQVSLEQWNKVLEINSTGVYLSCKIFGAQMVKQGKGSIINFTSIYGIVGSGRGNSTYAASKGLIIGYSKELAIEWASSGVRVNIIAPCQFMGPNLERMAREEFNYNELMKVWTSNIPLGKVGSPEEMAGPVIFLASDAACMITGIVLPVDGGYLAR